MMTLASIAVLLASLNTRSDYQFVDVSAIDVTGDKQASTEEYVRGEHIARFYEWLAESKWIMQACGATIPSALREWSPAKPHEIKVDGINSTVAAYDAVVISDPPSPARWVNGDAHNSSLLCYSKSLSNVGWSDETVETIASKSWNFFVSSGYTSYLYPTAVSLPTVSSGNPISSSVINSLNARNISSTSSANWRTMGANSSWTWRDNGYAESSYTLQSKTWADGAPFNFAPNYVAKIRAVNDHFRPYQHNDNYRNEWSVPNIIKGEGNHETTPFTVIYHSANNPSFRLANGTEIKGRTGIPMSLDKGEAFVFFCCWKSTAVNEGESNWNMNIRVYAKRAYLRTNNISALADEVWNATPYPSGSGGTHTGYVAVLFVGHASVRFDPNASSD